MNNRAGGRVTAFCPHCEGFSGHRSIEPAPFRVESIQLEDGHVGASPGHRRRVWANGNPVLEGRSSGHRVRSRYHMIETFERPDHCALWLEAERGEPVDWQALVEGYRATVDWPGCRFYRPLMEAFPEAKVILTVRDPESWYDSVSATIHNRPAGREPRPDDDIRTQMVRAVVWDGSLEGRFDDRMAAIDIFRRHIEEVKHTVPVDRLLVSKHARDGARSVIF